MHRRLFWLLSLLSVFMISCSSHLRNTYFTGNQSPTFGLQSLPPQKHAQATKSLNKSWYEHKTKQVTGWTWTLPKDSDKITVYPKTVTPPKIEHRYQK